jgi:hypothetical protein
MFDVYTTFVASHNLEELNQKGCEGKSFGQAVSFRRANGGSQASSLPGMRVCLSRGQHGSTATKWQNRIAQGFSPGSGEK